VVGAKKKNEPRKLPTQARAKATVEAILQAAARVLIEEGFARASTNRIAELAGVSIGSLYQYFPSKEALVSALLERHLAEAMAVVGGRIRELATAPLGPAVRELVGLMIELHRHDPELHRVFMEQVPRENGVDRLQEIDAQVTALVQSYLELRKDELRVRDVALASILVVETVEALTHGAVLFRPDLLHHPGFADQLTDLVVRYLAKDPPPRRRGSGRRRPARP
jgi:AcrR family transcriptional regulator